MIEGQSRLRGLSKEQMQDGTQKPVLYFEGAQKGIVCNRTNARVVALLANRKKPTTAVGTKIEVFTELVGFRGDVVQAIRFRAPNGQATTAESPTTSGELGRRVDDEIRSEDQLGRLPGRGRPAWIRSIRTSLLSQPISAGEVRFSGHRRAALAHLPSLLKTSAARRRPPRREMGSPQPQAQRPPPR